MAKILPDAMFVIHLSRSWHTVRINGFCTHTPWTADMRTSQFPLQTVKETPSDAEISSHQLMIRAGMIRKLAAGLYTWLPLGLRVLRKIESIVREEMDRSGALEVLMPSIQPAELWQESGRWEQYGPELLRLNDRHKRAFCYGPTHERSSLIWPVTNCTAISNCRSISTRSRPNSATKSDPASVSCARASF